ncbi:hypothetical protein ABUW04_21480 [Streptacidiphilus sp. N1-10]|uniref:Uncharacterized protein n=1 Tax=Streptacidiphilus jeojiensis TaxID=3229225 RepID=A0ABV6XRD2_9ACTN
MSTSVKVDQQDSTFRPEGTVGTVAWSVGGERRTATLRIVRRETADLPRPSDLLTFTQAAPAPTGTSAEQPTRITDRRSRRQSPRTRTRPVHEAA